MDSWQAADAINVAEREEAQQQEEEQEEAQRQREEREEAQRQQEEQAERARLQREREAEEARLKVIRDLAEQRRSQEQSSLKAISKTTRNCPGCDWAIEKISGCDHMICKCFISPVMRARAFESDLGCEPAAPAWSSVIPPQPSQYALVIRKRASMLMISTGTQCKFQFCYRCGADFHRILTGGNKMHARDCQHYA